MKRPEHGRRMIAPIVITLLFLVYLAAYGIAVAMTVEWTPAIVLLAIPLLALGVGMVAVLRSRIQEIRSGEEDDLSHY